MKNRDGAPCLNPFKRRFRVMTATSGITAWVVDEKAIASMIMWWEPLQRVSQPSHGEISSSGPCLLDVWDNNMLTPTTGFCLMCGMTQCSPPPQATQKRCLPTKARAPVSRRLVFVGTNGPHPGLIYSSAWHHVTPPEPADFILLTLEPTVLHEKQVQGGSTGRLRPATPLG